MKATIDIPDELYRKVKAKSALEGRPVREVAIELFRTWVDESDDGPTGRPAVSAYDLMKEYRGMVDSGVPDLATNPEHMRDFGRDSMGDQGQLLAQPGAPGCARAPRRLPRRADVPGRRPPGPHGGAVRPP